MSRRAKPPNMGEGARAEGARGVIDLDRLAPRPRPRQQQLYSCQGLIVGAGSSSSLSTSPPPCPTPPRASPGRASRGKRTSRDSGVSDETYARQRQARHLSPDARDATIKQFRVQCASALREQRAQLARVARLCERLSRHAGQCRGERGETGTDGKGVESIRTQKQEEPATNRTKESKFQRNSKNKLKTTESRTTINQEYIPRLNVNSIESQQSRDEGRSGHRSEHRSSEQSSTSEASYSNRCRSKDRKPVRLNPPDASAACRQVTARLEGLVRGWLSRATREQAAQAGHPQLDEDTLTKTCVDRGASAWPLLGSSTRTRVLQPSSASCASQYRLDDPVKLYEQSKHLQSPPARRARSAGTRQVYTSGHSPAYSPAYSPQHSPAYSPDYSPGGSPACSCKRQKESGAGPRWLCALCRASWRALRRSLADAADQLDATYKYKS